MELEQAIIITDDDSDDLIREQEEAEVTRSDDHSGPITALADHTNRNPPESKQDDRAGQQDGSAANL